MPIGTSKSIESFLCYIISVLARPTSGGYLELGPYGKLSSGPSCFDLDGDLTGSGPGPFGLSAVCRVEWNMAGKLEEAAARSDGAGEVCLD